MLLGLGYGFNKLKVFYLGIHVLVMFFFLKEYLFDLHPSFQEIVLPYVIALNIAIILMIKDGAVLSIQGKAVAFFLMFEALLVYIFYKNILSFLLVQSFPFQLKFIQIPDYSALFFLIILMIYILNIVRSFTTYKVFLLGSIIAILLSLPIDNNIGSQLFLITSSILLLLAVVFRTYAMAYIDELTKIPSRRMLKVDLMKLGSKYSIAMLDIDFFKKFNDKYGHDVGDDVLILVAKGLMNVTGGGKAYRYGGEEFTIVFPKKNSEDVLSHLEDLREKISKKEYLYKKKNRSGDTSIQKLKVTISIGVAEKQGKTKSPSEVLKAADKALYRAKKKGRNCVSK
ncbi:GGDEF domain-containing protein [Bacillus sp. RD4P76]|uniref:GGDEF domain-containing protein n=2 Tax=Bacillus suaedaesalsae TaxID=2810349 RepID=A0ABS2DIK1_9BACI|nr:GGDEF domain-containing protein [Bacillus suaedaesalsae]